MLKQLRIALVSLIILGSSAYAQVLPDYYPDSFQRTGTIDDIRPGSIVVDDMLFSIAGAVLVHSLREQRTYFSRLARGDLIGYRVGSDRQIVEIWILPEDYDARLNQRY